MGVDQSGQQDDFAKVGDGAGPKCAQFPPRTDRDDAIPGNGNRAVLNGRRGYGNHDAGAEQHGYSALSALERAFSFRREATLCFFAFALLCFWRSCCSSFFVAASIAA